MSWQDDWRLQAWNWARRLDQVAMGWSQLEREGKMSSSAVAQKRQVVLKVRSWIYEIIETFLGGVDKLPNRVPIGTLGALPHLVVGGVVLVTVASVGAWVSNEEERLIEAKRLFTKTVAEEARKTTDPVVRRKLGDLIEDIGDDGGGFPWRWVFGALGLAAGAEYVRRRLAR